MSDLHLPAFAKDYPASAELDALVRAFEEGNFGAVRTGAPALAAKAEDARVREAALDLARRTTPDPLAKWLFLFATLLLVGLTGYWLAHDGPGPEAPKPPPTIEYVK